MVYGSLATDKVYTWGSPGYQPVTGDWNGDGKVKIGTYNPTLAYLVSGL